MLSVKRTGVYHSLTLVAPDIADSARPGQFVEIAVPNGRSILLNRPFSIHQASRRGGFAGTLEVVFDIVGPGTAWLAEVEQHQQLDVIGPLGRSFQYPKGLRSCLLVGGGYGAAPLHFLAEELRAHDKDVSMIWGPAATNACSNRSRASGSHPRSRSRPMTARWGSGAGSSTSSRP